MQKKQIFKCIQVLATIGLLSFVFYKVGLFSEQGRQDFFAVLTQANLRWLGISIVVGILVNISSTIKWFGLVRAQNLQCGFFRVWAYYLIGQFYNLILPTSVGGDAVRSYELGKFTGNQAKSLASVFVERYTGVLVLLACSFVAVMMQLSIFNVNFVVASLVAFALGLGFIAWMLIDRRLYQSVRKLILAKLPMLDGVFVKVDKLLLSIDDYRNKPSSIFWAFFHSFVFYFLAVVNVYVTARVFELNVDFTDMLIATPIIMLIMNIPLSIGNFGIMEFAYFTIFQMMGYSPTLGLSVAVLMRLKSLLDGVMGGVAYPFFVTQKEDTDAEK